LLGGITKSKLFARLDNMLETCRDLTGRTRDIDICETNGPGPGTGRWFALVAEWLDSHGGGRIQGSEPDRTTVRAVAAYDMKTVARLQSIASTYADS
jgi:hypothetical protein